MGKLELWNDAEKVRLFLCEGILYTVLMSHRNPIAVPSLIIPPPHRIIAHIGVNIFNNCLLHPLTPSFFFHILPVRLRIYFLYIKQ